MYSVESVSGIERTETNGSQKAAGERGKWTETGGWKGGDEMLVHVLTMHATQHNFISEKRAPNAGQGESNKRGWDPSPYPFIPTPSSSSVAPPSN